MSHPDGEGPVTRNEAKDRVKSWFDKPEHAPKEKDPRNDKTRDDPLDDPNHEVPD